MARTKRTIRACEIGSFLYCQRAWWYRRHNAPAINTAELAGGEVFHRQHVSHTRSAHTLKLAAWILLVLALVAILITLFR